MTMITVVRDPAWYSWRHCEIPSPVRGAVAVGDLGFGSDCGYSCYRDTDDRAGTLLLPDDAWALWADGHPFFAGLLPYGFAARPCARNFDGERVEHLRDGRCGTLRAHFPPKNSRRAT